jgi:DNA-directed RNA polymerase subunit M/transcription elongation factor TFIIS
MLTCPKCKSEKIIVNTEQISGKTKTKGAGCLWTLLRWLLIICTCGLWLLFGKRKATSKTTFENQTVGLCQNCGNKWVITS